MFPAACARRTWSRTGGPLAQEAAISFIEEQADDTRIGLVAFAGFAEIVVPPTNDKERLKQAVEGFTTSLGTAIGSATYKAIDAIAQENDAVAPSGVNLRSQGGDALEDAVVVYRAGHHRSREQTEPTAGDPAPWTQPRPRSTPGVRVYTIGFGSDDRVHGLHPCPIGRGQSGRRLWRRFSGRFWFWVVVLTGAGGDAVFSSLTKILCSLWPI